MDEELLSVLKKRAVGYTAEERVTEYDSEGNEVKQRITKKDVPPDLPAIKLLLEMTDDEELTESELELERAKILRELADYYDNKKRRRKNSGN